MVRDIPVFNAREFRQPVDFRNIIIDNCDQAPAVVRGCLNSVLDRAVEGTPPGSVLNVVLRGPSLSSDVQAVLNSDDYNADIFLDEIARVMQSNADTMGDDQRELLVSVAWNRSGGGGKRLRLGKVLYDEILARKGKRLYNRNNDDNLCFSMCLTHKLHSDKSQSEKQNIARHLHIDVGLDITQQVSFSNLNLS